MESPLDFRVCDIAGIWRKSPLQLEICPLLKRMYHNKSIYQGRFSLVFRSRTLMALPIF